MPDEAADALFGALRSNRNRALASFWLSSGARASELLGLRHGGDLDAGRNTSRRWSSQPLPTWGTPEPQGRNELISIEKLTLES